MKAGSLAMLLVSFLLMLFLASPATIAADAPKEPITIKIEGAKMPPVAFSHEAHQKRGIDCAKCHHKDAKDPKACTICHEKEPKGAAIPAKEAFHNMCISCHKDMAKDGLKAPTKCMECHKR